MAFAGLSTDRPRPRCGSRPRRAQTVLTAASEHPGAGVDQAQHRAAVVASERAGNSARRPVHSHPWVSAADVDEDCERSERCAIRFVVVVTVRRRDDSAWIVEMIRDDDLARDVAEIEQASHLAPPESRPLVRDAIDGRYMLRR